MKLHLPKLLLTAVLAAVAMAPAAWGASDSTTNSGWDKILNGQSQVATDSYGVGDASITSIDTADSTSNSTNLFIRTNNGVSNATIGTLTIADGDTLKIQGWHESNENHPENFSSLTITTLNLGNNSKLYIDSGDVVNLSSFALAQNTSATIEGKATYAAGTVLTLNAGTNLTLENAGTIVMRNQGASDADNTAVKTTGTGTLTIGNGTTVELANGGQSPTCAIEGAITVKGGGTLLLSGNKSLLGYNNNDKGALTLEGSSADSKALVNITSTQSQHLSRNLVMKGNAEIKGIDGAYLTTYPDTKTVAFTISGTNNTISVDVHLESGVNVSTTNASDKLTISGDISHTDNKTNAFIKSGAGTLTLSGTNTFNGELKVNAGQLDISGLTTANKLVTAASGANLVVKEEGNATFSAGLQLNGGLKIESGQLALGGALDITATGKTITNAGTLDLSNLTSINIHSFKGLSTTSDFALSDGENGIITQGEYILVQNNGGSVTADGVSATLTGYGACTISNQDGTLTTAVSGTYMVNTEVSYNSATMGSVSKFWVDPSGTLNTTDASMLNKVQLGATSSQLYYQNTAGDDLLRFSGTMGSAGLNLSASNKTVTATGNNSGFTGDITVLSGTTLKAADGSKDSAIFGASCETTQDRTIRVQNNATLDVNGSETYYRVVLEGGATLANYSSSDVNESWKALPYLKLEGNATISATSKMVMQKKGNSSHENKLILGGNTLTKTGEGVFIIKTGAIESDGGTIKVDAGGFKIDGGSTSGNFNLVINGGYFQTGAAASVSSLTMGASAQEICIANNTTTVSGVTTSEGTMKKSGAGTLTLNGAANLNGLNITNGTVNLNGVTTLGGAITLGANGATANLAVGESGSVVIKNLVLFSPANGVPATNGLVTDRKYKVVTKNTANSTHNLNTVTYYGDALTLDADGYVTGGSVYYAVEQGTTVNVGGDHATNGTADATEFYVGEHGHLSYADTFGTTGGSAAVPTIDNLSGTGKVSIRLAAAAGSSNMDHHDNAVSISDAFKGTLEVSGRMNLTSFSLGKDAKLQLASGEHWSDGGSVNTDILLAETKGAYEFRHSGTLTLNGEVSGKYLDVGTVNGAGTLKLTNAANDIENVTLGTSNKVAHLTLAADMAFTSLTLVNSGSNVTLESGVATVAKLVTHANGNTIRLNKNATLNVLSSVTGGNVTLVGDGSYYMQDGSASSSDRVRLGQDWRGTAIARNIYIGGIELATMGNADSTIKLQGLSGWIKNEDQYKTVTSDVILENYTAGDTVTSAMVITDHSNATYAFQGAVYGSGDFELASKANDNGNAMNGGVFEFSGDTSGWTGGVVVNSASDGSAYTPKITLQLIGGDDIFSAEENGGITVNRDGGTVELQFGNTGKASTMHGAIVNNGTGSVDVKVNANTKNVTFNEAVNINGTLTVDGEGATLVAAENSVGSLDLSKSNASTGTLKLKENVSLNVSTNFRGGKNASVELEKGASLTKGVIRISGVEQTSAGVVSKLESTTKANDHDDVYTVGKGSFTISNADVTIASDSEQTIGNVLNNSSLINDGGTAQTSTGKVIANNQANSFVDVKAITGNIELMNLVNGGVQNLEVAAGKSVVATGTDSAKATVSVSGQATFGAGATLSANLTLESNAELVSVGEGGIAIGGADSKSILTLGSNIGLGNELKAKLDCLTGDATLVLFTNVSDLTLNDAAVEAALLSARNSGTTSVTTADASTVFAGIAADKYTINLAQGQVFLSAMPVPEPTTSMLGLVGLVALTFRRRRK